MLRLKTEQYPTPTTEESRAPIYAQNSKVTLENINVTTSSNRGVELITYGDTQTTPKDSETMVKDCNITVAKEGIMSQQGTTNCKVNVVISGGSIKANGTGVHIQPGTTATISDSTINSETYGVYVAGEIMMDNTTVTGKEIGCVVIGDSSTKLTATGCSITGGSCGISGHGESNGDTITLIDTDVTATDNNLGMAIYHPQDGDLTINGGNITGASGIQFIGDGKLTINNGNITATGTDKSNNQTQAGPIPRRSGGFGCNKTGLRRRKRCYYCSH